MWQWKGSLIFILLVYCKNVFSFLFFSGTTVNKLQNLMNHKYVYLTETQNQQNIEYWL